MQCKIIESIISKKKKVAYEAMHFLDIQADCPVIMKTTGHMDVIFKLNIFYTLKQSYKRTLLKLFFLSKR